MASISLCMIARDEAARIGPAIHSCAGVADEVIVVDTGSTDRTVDIARECGARVVQTPWQDDFSKPRNLSFELATGEWLLVLDCDEQLQESSRGRVLDACRRNAAPAYAVTRLEHGPSGFSHNRLVRLARRDAGCWLTGRIHERPVHPFTAVADSGIVIDHYGCQHRAGDAAAQMRLRLLRLELADHPQDNYLLTDLLDGYWRQRDERWQEILPRAIATLDTSASRPPHPLAATLLEILFRLPPESLPVGFSKTQAESLAERWFEGELPLLALRMRWQLENQSYAQAARLGETALLLCERQAQESPASFRPEVVAGELHLQLGVAYAGINRLAEARSILGEALRFPEVASAAMANLAQIARWRHPPVPAFPRVAPAYAT